MVYYENNVIYKVGGARSTQLENGQTGRSKTKLEMDGVKALNK